MTTQSKISVIIPVYNASEHLTECLESLLKQTYTDFEAICINDGSTDNSLEILNYYQNKDKRIRVFNQENQGTATAREQGIKNASGRWVAYVDADDYVSPDYLEKLYICAQKENGDAVFCYYYEDWSGALKKHKKKIKNLKIAGLGKFPYITGASKIARRELFDNVVFAPNCNFGEDSSISMQIALQNPKICILPEYLYFYRQHPNSTVLQKAKIYVRIASLLKGYEAIENYCRSQNRFTREMQKYLYRQLKSRIDNLILEACR